MRQIGNTSYSTQKVAVCTREEEFAALEMFGPCVREAIANAALPVLAFSTLDTILTDYEKLKEKHPNIPPLDLKRPDVDRGIALGIINNTAYAVMQDREPNDKRTQEERISDARAGCRPLVPRRVRRAV